MYKKTVQLLSDSIAIVKFDEYCKELDKRFEKALNAAFEGERISQERMQRIGNRFIEKLHEVK